MDAKDIARVLLRHYCNYQYKLFNTNVFAWESDFFAISDSGYVTEVETKISRSDYFRDFFKEKHRLFKALQSKGKYIVEGYGGGRGDFLCDEVEYKEMQQRFHSNKLGYNDPIVMHNYNFNKRSENYIVNDYNDTRLKPKIIPAVFAKATHIKFKEVGKQNAPHKFYFACPEKLIKPEEVPAYAGLLYVSDSVRVVKSAPFLHKNKMDLTAILLKKFYNLWQYRATTDEKIQTVKDEDSSRENESAA